MRETLEFVLGVDFALTVVGRVLEHTWIEVNEFEEALMDGVSILLRQRRVVSREKRGTVKRALAFLTAHYLLSSLRCDVGKSRACLSLTPRLPVAFSLNSPSQTRSEYGGGGRNRRYGGRRPRGGGGGDRKREEY